MSIASRQFFSVTVREYDVQRLDVDVEVDKSFWM